MPHSIPFKAETKQLLDILINSLYSDKDVFLRELVSNASDAITRLNFELLTNSNVVDAGQEPAIRIYADKENFTLRVVDNGLGMNESEIKENLGTIAKSGARSFLEAAKEKPDVSITDLIGQFGVGFYAAFMVADWIEVTSRSFRPEDQAVRWRSEGTGSYTIEPADKQSRGTEIFIKLKEDAKEYAEEFKLRGIIRQHSNYIPYPIYFGDGEERINAESALWRQSPSDLSEEDYEKFYQTFTMDFEKPIAKLHLSIDAPFQMYSLLFVPSKAEKTMFSLRKEDGVQLYARKVLIQDYCTDLLPRYYRFVTGIIDSEDIPLNVTRETMQANRVILTLRKILAGKVTDMLKKMGTEQPKQYTKFWKEFGPYLCEGIVTEPDAKDSLIGLLRYRSLNHADEYRSLADYVLEMKPGQDKIYYLLGEEIETLRNSPHLEILKKEGLDVLLLTDPFDPFVITTLNQFQDFQFANAAMEKEKKEEKDNAEKTDDSSTPDEKPQYEPLISLFKNALGEKVAEVRVTERLVDSPARLVTADGGISPEMEKMYHLMKQDMEKQKKVLEINPHHPLIQKVENLGDQPLAHQIMDQILDGAKLMDGEPTDTYAMLKRVQDLLVQLLH